MTANTLEERKRYISQIKASFPDPTQSRYRDFSAPAKPEHWSAGFFKLKALIAAAVFTAFVFCDRNQIKISDYTTGQIAERIKETVSLEKMMQTLEKYDINDIL